METCLKCNSRSFITHLREPYFYDENFDSTMGLSKRSEQFYYCSECLRYYFHNYMPSSMFHDYDEYDYTKLNQTTSQLIHLFSSNQPDDNFKIMAELAIREDFHIYYLDRYVERSDRKSDTDLIEKIRDLLPKRD